MPVATRPRPLASAAQRHVRQIGWRPGERLVDRLRPDDDIVEVTLSSLDALGPGEPWTVKDVIEDAAVRADAVAVVTVDIVDTALALDESWIDTRLFGTVEEVLRSSSRGKLQPRQRFEAHISGGEIVLGTVRVRAGTVAPVIRPQVPEHRRYLLFLEQSPSALYPLHPPLLVENGKLRYVTPFRAQNLPPSPLEGLALTDVAEVVRAAKTSRMFQGKTIIVPAGR